MNKILLLFFFIILVSNAERFCYDEEYQYLNTIQQFTRKVLISVNRTLQINYKWINYQGCSKHDLKPFEIFKFQTTVFDQINNSKLQSAHQMLTNYTNGFISVLNEERQLQVKINNFANFLDKKGKTISTCIRFGPKASVITSFVPDSSTCVNKTLEGRVRFSRDLYHFEDILYAMYRVMTDRLHAIRTENDKLKSMLGMINMLLTNISKVTEQIRKSLSGEQSNIQRYKTSAKRNYMSNLVKQIHQLTAQDKHNVLFDTIRSFISTLLFDEQRGELKNIGDIVGQRINMMNSKKAESMLMELMKDLLRFLINYKEKFALVARKEQTNQAVIPTCKNAPVDVNVIFHLEDLHGILRLVKSLLKRMTLKVKID